MATPDIISNFNLIVDGVPQKSKVSNFTPPELARKLTEVQAGGMLSPVQIQTGFEALEASFKYQGYDAEAIAAFKESRLSGLPIRLRAAQENNQTGNVDAVEITMKGRMSKIALGELTVGDKNEQDVTMPLTYYKYQVNDRVVFEFDTLNFIFIVDGVDLYEEHRQALGL